MNIFFLFSISILLSIGSFAQSNLMSDVKIGFIPCLDNQLYYEEVGEGEPLIFAHAGSLDHSMWDDQFLFFANHGFKVIRFDSYAHGNSISGKNTPFLHELIKSIIDHFDFEKVNLLGTSMGGVTLIEFALNHPENIDKMVLVGTGINGYNWGKDTLFLPKLQKQIAYVSDLDTLNVVEMFLQSWTDGPYREPNEISANIREKNKRIILEKYRHHGFRETALKSHPQAIKKYKNIKSNTLILLGEKDMPSIHDISHMLDEGLENSKLIELMGVGHMMNMESPEEFNRIVLEFLEK